MIIPPVRRPDGAVRDFEARLQKASPSGHAGTSSAFGRAPSRGAKDPGHPGIQPAEVGGIDLRTSMVLLPLVLGPIVVPTLYGRDLIPQAVCRHPWRKDRSTFSQLWSTNEPRRSDFRLPRQQFVLQYLSCLSCANRRPLWGPTLSFAAIPPSHDKGWCFPINLRDEPSD